MRIKEEISNEIVIDKSRFICYLNRAFNEEEARNYLSRIKKLHPQATHHCYAYITNNNMVERFSDDGEPSGTAAKPMLDVLHKNNLEDVIVIVVRYFGGIKLGAGGLIRAYSNSVSNTLCEATLVTPTQINLYQLKFGYEYINSINYLLNETKILKKDYEVFVYYEFVTNDDKLINKIIETTKGQFIPEFIKQIEIEL